MADLIIKPTSGNLLIKDDQDATRMTVATTTGNITLGSLKVTKPTDGLGSNLVQIVSSSNTTEYNNDAITYNGAMAPSCVIKPKYSDSKLYVTASACVNLHGGSNNDNLIGVVGIWEGTVGTVRAETRVGGADLSSDHYTQCYMQYMGDAGTAGVAQTFGIAARRYSSGFDNAVRIAQDSFPTVVTIMEFCV